MKRYGEKTREDKRMKEINGILKRMIERRNNPCYGRRKGREAGTNPD